MIGLAVTGWGLPSQHHKLASSRDYGMGRGAGPRADAVVERRPSVVGAGGTTRRGSGARSRPPGTRRRALTYKAGMPLAAESSRLAAIPAGLGGDTAWRGRLRPSDRTGYGPRLA